MPPKISDDPCGLVCVIITYIAVFYADYAVVRHMVLTSMSDSLWGAFHTVLFNIIVLLITASHLRAAFSDPGIVAIPRSGIDFSDINSLRRKNPDKESQGWTTCTKCEMYRPPRAHHCRICRRCIRRMDHHCPWVNNCIGEFNQKYFIQFLFYVGLSSVYAVVIVIISWISSSSNLPPDVKQAKILHSIILVIESIFFGIFVIAIGCDQGDAICRDQTGIEYVKKSGRNRTHMSTKALCQEVFGKGPMYMWLCPFQSRMVREHDESFDV